MNDAPLTKCFFHVDLDAFFASVEQLEHPEYRGKPLIVGGDPKQRRNVVSTASYEARAFGVHSAMPTFKAYELCPQGIFVDCDMKLYSRYSKKVMNILMEFSPDFRQVSIDEAFLDMTGTQRLFGEPLEAARLLKSRIKNETGLTISVGIASNAYLAKIASDIKKPDGLYIIPNGQEEAFMESLPLSKVWGIGDKSLKRLNESGFKTVTDIKKHSLALLQTIMGNASAGFLYNVVRGIQPEGFLAESKTHTLSNESTYPYDLYDREIIHTCIMELCHTVMFRLLENGLTSYTVAIKIRYDDFSTFNAQQTFSSPILCIDELYEYAVNLFEKKYEDGKGIRLLGVGVHNVISKNQIVQQELFPSQTEKQQCIEKAILNLENKNPNIKIHKARLLQKTKVILGIVLLGSAFFCNQLHAAPDNPRASRKIVDAQENQGFIVNPEILVRPGTTPTSLFSFDIKDSHVEFFADGYWNMSIKENLNATFGFGNPFVFSAEIPVFTQEIDLALWFMLNNQWYLQGAFADKFEKSTIAAGFTNGKLIKDLMISNRNIVFPQKYGVDDIGRGIGGGDNQAPGIMINLESPDKKWNLDAAVRYDMLQTQDKTFYGKNLVTTTKISKESYLTGTVFILPESDCVKKVTSVYVENSSGTYTDEAGRIYKKLSSADYKLYPVKNQIILSTDCGSQKRNSVTPRVLIEFETDADTAINSSALGTYGTAEIPGTGYLGQIQKYFGSDYYSASPSDKKNIIPDVAIYSYGDKINHISSPDYSGNKTEGFFVLLGSKKMLLAQNSTGFSPFMAAFRYDGGTLSGNDVIVASGTTQTKSSAYSAIISDEQDFTQNQVYSFKHTYLDVYKTDAGSQDFTSAKVNFPFANISPMTYLSSTSQNDLVIMSRTYSPVSRFGIGTNAVNGTVRVYKNSVLVDDIIYNPQTGEVKIPSGVSQTDKIYITWSEESKSFSRGMISGAAGYKYNITDTLSADVSASTQWALSPDLTYASYENSQYGFTTLSARIKWDTENIKLSNTTGVTFDIENVTGNYRLLGIDTPKSQTNYLTSDALKELPANFIPALNHRPQNSLLPRPLLERNYNGNVPKTTGSTDTGITGYKVPVGWNFSGIQGLTGEKLLWSSVTVSMPANKGSLVRGSRFELAVKDADKLTSLASGGKCKVYLQLGVNDQEDFTAEDSYSIPTWCIYDSMNIPQEDVIAGIDTAKNQWQTVSVLLRDQDRAAIKNNYSARITVVLETDTIPPVPAGEFFVGPYMLSCNDIYTSSEKAITVTQEQTKASGNNSNIFKQTEKYTDNVYWNIEDFSHVSQKVSDPNIRLYNYFEETDISSYKAIDLYFSYNAYGLEQDVETTSIYNDSYALTIIMDRQEEGTTQSIQKAVEIKIPASALKKYINTDFTTSIHHLQLDRITGQVYINDKLIPGAVVHTNSDIKPSRLCIIVNTAVMTENTNNKICIFEKGKFTVNEFFLSQNSPQIVLDNIAKVNLKKDGDIWNINNFAILKDASFNALGDFTGSFSTDKNITSKYGLRTAVDAGITLATIKLSAKAARAQQSKYGISNAGHDISTTTPILKVLSFEENFLVNKEDKSMSKYNNVMLDFTRLNFPLTLKAGTDVLYDNWTTTQNASSNLNLNIGQPGKFLYTLNATALTNQKISDSNSTEENGSSIQKTSYFENYKDAFLYQFSTGSQNANRRIIDGKINNLFDFGFAGFKPSVNLEASGNYTNATYTSFTDKIDFSTEFPFTINRNTFAFKYQKTTGQVKITDKGGSYITDTQNTAKAFNERPWYFTAFPVYDLISSKLGDQVLSQSLKNGNSFQDETGISQKLYYSGLYEFSWKRPIFANKYDFFIPTTASFALSRDIDSSQNLTDIYQLKTTAGFTSFNIFSANGAFPILKCFEQDEYTASLQYALKIPRTDPGQVRHNVNAYVLANFYVNQNDILKTAASFSFEDKDSWSVRLNAGYKRSSNFTPILAFIKLFAKKADFSKVGLTRTDSIAVTLSSTLSGNSTDTKVTQYQSYEYIHQLDMALTNFATIYTGFDTSFTWTKDRICTLGLEITLGGKLQF
ncbi:MAG: DNA polymerase IV [Treponema sp.]|nr:DNA polymerase IV [Treponema sp.]